MDSAAASIATVISDLRAQGLHVTPDGRVLPEVAAGIIGVSEGTLRNWRNADTGPDYFRTGRIWYRLTDILGWIEGCRENGSTEDHDLS
jgi:hypothetical protein